MKSLLIFLGLLAGLNIISGQHLTVKWSAAKPINASDACAEQPSWTLMADSQDCGKFYVCVNHDTEEFICASNYYFDKIELRCKLGQCPYNGSFSEVKCHSHEVQRIAQNCNVFNACLNGKLELNTCPNGQYFNANYGSCQKIMNNAQHKCSCILPDNALVPNTDNCETYYVCIEGKAVLQQCPRGQYYNERVSSCLPDLEGVCLTLPTMSPVEKEVLEVCRNGGIQGEIFQPHKDDCGKFFLCLNGRVFTMQCPKGFYYDGVSHVCNFDVKQKCVRKQKQKQKEKELIQKVTEEIKKHPVKPEEISPQPEPPKQYAPPPSHQSNHSNKKNNKKETLKDKVEEQRHKEEATKEPSKVVEVKFTLEADIQGNTNKDEKDTPKVDKQKEDKTKSKQKNEKESIDNDEIIMETIKKIKNKKESSKKQKHEEKGKDVSNVDLKLTVEADVHPKNKEIKKELHAEKEIAIKTKVPENKEGESSEQDKKHKKKNTNKKESSKVENQQHEDDTKSEKESPKVELKLTVEADIQSQDKEIKKDMPAEKTIEIKKETETYNKEAVEEIQTAESLQKLPQEKPTKSLYDKLSSKFMNF